MVHSNAFASIIRNAKLEINNYNFIDRDVRNSHYNRVLDSYSISYMRSGSSRLNIYGAEYIASAGDVLIIPPHVLHDHIMCWEVSPSFMWWNFTYKLYGMIDILCMLKLPIIFRIADNDTFENALQSYLNCLEMQNKFSDYIYTEAKALELLAIFLDMASIIEEDELFQAFPNTFVSILADIIHHPEQQNLLPVLAMKYRMHPTYISNQFKKLYRVTPTQFHRRVRLQKAKDLLIGDRNLTISEISNILGYEYPADFTRFFKTQCNMTPQQYRNIKHSVVRVTTETIMRGRDSLQ